MANQFNIKQDMYVHSNIMQMDNQIHTDMMMYMYMCVCVCVCVCVYVCMFVCAVCVYV